MGVFFLLVVLIAGLVANNGVSMNRVSMDVRHDEGRPVMIVRSNLSNLIVYPNPCRGDKITFKGLESGATVKIFTVSGELVSSSVTSSEIWEWDCKDIANGVYIYLVSTGGEKKRGKIAITR